MKKKVAILFGGKCAEHSISIMSAIEIDKILKSTNDYEIHYLGIGIDNAKIRQLDSIPLEETLSFVDNEPILTSKELEVLYDVDVVLPVLHGNYGEDGRLQGFLDILGVKYIGEGVLSSAICMDKDITKRILRDSGIKVVPWTTLYKDKEYNLEDLEYPVFVKPASQGSSIGITKVKRKKQLDLAIKEAFISCDKVLIEKNINGREIECAVFNDVITEVGEVVASHEFYDYEAKYFDDGKSLVKVPTDLEQNIVEKIRDIVKQIVEKIGIQSISRVDFFVTDENEIYLNEINTFPGFTKYSMYPKLVEQKGYTRSQLLDALIKKASR